MTNKLRIALIVSLLAAGLAAARAEYGSQISGIGNTSTHVYNWLRYANAFCGPSKGKLRRATVTWTGACRGGLLEGPGTLDVELTSYSGVTIDATFVAGHAEGPGRVVFHSPPVTTFEGEFHDNQPNGHGVFLDADGRRVEGNYVYDEITDGPVVISYPDGSRFNGVLAGFNLDFRRVFTHADGTRDETPVGMSHHVLTTFADGGRLETDYYTYYSEARAIYCTPGGVRIAGHFEAVRSDPANAALPVPYPALSRRLNEEGSAEVSFVVAADGSTSHIALHRSSGSPRLDPAALAAVAQWRYLPARVDGQPIAMPTIVAVYFELHPGPVSPWQPSPPTPLTGEWYLGNDWVLGRCAVRRTP